MNSRERVLAVFEHELPDRVPCWCGASVEFWKKAKKELGLDDEGFCQLSGIQYKLRLWKKKGIKLTGTNLANYRILS